MKMVRWAIGAIILLAALSLILIRPLPFLHFEGAPLLGFFGRGLYIIILSCVLCLFRIWKGPTGADRVVAIDILGIMIVGLCALLTVVTGRTWYIDISIAWALQSFISTLALSKYLQGKDFHE